MAPRGNTKKTTSSNAKGESSKSKGDAKKDEAKAKPGNVLKIRHILCKNATKRDEALRKIEEEGVRFDVVARELSLDKAKHGNPRQPHWSSVQSSNAE